MLGPKLTSMVGVIGSGGYNTNMNTHGNFEGSTLMIELIRTQPERVGKLQFLVGVNTHQCNGCCIFSDLFGC